MGIDVRDIAIRLDNVDLAGTLSTPEKPAGLVIFAHGSGSSRHSPRNRYVADALNQHGLATLLFDLLTPEEELADEEDAALRFDVDLLASRLAGATDSVIAQGHKDMPIGYFGASTGAAAALMAAAQRPTIVSAVVSRGGRPDLAADSLLAVRAPTLLIVGARDTWVLQANQQAATRLLAKHEIAIVPGATHLFEEPGALDDVSHLAGSWFLIHFAQERIRHAV